MIKQDIAILFSGGTDSVALYALCAAGNHPLIPRPRSIHVLCMVNGMSRFDEFPQTRFKVAQQILSKQTPQNDKIPEAHFIELDMGRLFQGLWLDRYEELMPKYNGKNLVCVACKLGMHIRAIIYCIEKHVPLAIAGYTKKQAYYPEQTPAFMDRITAFSEQFGISTRYPVYDDFEQEMVTRHFLEEQGLPSTGGGERKCLFSQTLTTATDVEIGNYLDDFIPVASQYIEDRLEGRLQAASMHFPPGRTLQKNVQLYHSNSESV